MFIFKRIVCLPKMICAGEKLELEIKDVSHKHILTFHRSHLLQIFAVPFCVKDNQNTTSLIAATKIKSLTELLEGTDTRGLSRTTAQCCQITYSVASLIIFLSHLVYRLLFFNLVWENYVRQCQVHFRCCTSMLETGVTFQISWLQASCIIILGASVLTS